MWAAKQRYLAGEIGVDELERRVGDALRGKQPDYDEPTEIHIYYDGPEPPPLDLHL